MLCVLRVVLDGTAHKRFRTSRTDTLLQLTHWFLTESMRDQVKRTRLVHTQPVDSIEYKAGMRG